MTPLLLSLALAAPPAEPPPAEFARMLLAILNGSQMGPKDGWFGPAKRRHDWPWLAAAHGLAPADKLPRDQFRGPAASFAALDADTDGVLTAADFADPPPKPKDKEKKEPAKKDAAPKDADKTDAPPAKSAPEKKPEPKKAGNFSNSADAPSMLTLLKGLFAGEIGSASPGPAIDDPAPDFTLPTADGTGTVTLSKLVGPTPVVLVTGNFSCGPFRRQYPAVEALKKKYEGTVRFVGVYVREAHPTDGWRMASNDEGGVSVRQPRTAGERAGVARTCEANLKMTMPLAVDDIRDTVGHLYSGMPSRLYLIDRAGRIAYQSGRGPFGFKPAELEQAIHLLAVADELDKAKPAGDPLPQLTEAEAWTALPAGEGKGGPLPGWARTLAWSSPRTTAALIQLDQAMRVNSPVDAKLRAKVRWACARQTGSRYGEVAALADLLRAGGTAADVAALTGDWDTLPAAERTTLRFARKLTAMGSSVTDAEFEAVRKVHGDTTSVGLVLVIAYANFQDRLVMALGTPLADGELSVPAVTFKTPYVGGAVPPRSLPADPLDTPPPQVTDPAWLEVGAESLRRSMEAQTARPPRVRVPSFDELKANSPAGTFRPGQTVKINWSLAATGHQPLMTRAWLNCLRAFGAEANQSTVFEESAFWVVTRSVDCFY